MDRGRSTLVAYVETSRLSMQWPCHLREYGVTHNNHHQRAEEDIHAQCVVILCCAFFKDNTFGGFLSHVPGSHAGTVTCHEIQTWREIEIYLRSFAFARQGNNTHDFKCWFWSAGVWSHGQLQHIADVLHGAEKAWRDITGSMTVPSFL